MIALVILISTFIANSGLPDRQGEVALRAFVDQFCRAEFNGRDAFRIDHLVPPPGPKLQMDQTEAYGLVDFSADPLWIVRSYTIQEPLEFLKDEVRVQIRFEVIAKSVDRSFMRQVVFKPESEVQTLQVRHRPQGWVVLGPWFPKVGLAGMKARIDEDMAQLRSANADIAKEPGLRGNMYRELVKTVDRINVELRK